MRNGASDYLQKSHLARLVPALLHAVDAAETRRARVKADRDLVASKQRLHELAQHLQTSVEQERAAIAREIHDDVGGSLTALKFDLAWIARHSSSPQIVSRVQSALETVTHAVESSQRIMHNLRPAILEQGLAAALHWIALRFERRSRHRVPDPPAEAAARAAGRRAAGGLSHRPGGAHQHQQARAGDAGADRPVARRRRALARDQRQRPRPEPGGPVKARSFGIRGLHERATTVGGWIDLSSGPHGTTLILSVPLDVPDSAYVPEPTGQVVRPEPMG